MYYVYHKKLFEIYLAIQYNGRVIDYLIILWLFLNVRLQ